LRISEKSRFTGKEVYTDGGSDPNTQPMNLSTVKEKSIRGKVINSCSAKTIEKCLKISREKVIDEHV
jgi:hypothetical protein